MGASVLQFKFLGYAGQPSRRPPPGFWQASGFVRACCVMYAGEDGEVCVELGYVGKEISICKGNQPDKSKAGGWPVSRAVEYISSGLSTMYVQSAEYISTSPLACHVAAASVVLIYNAIATLVPYVAGVAFEWFSCLNRLSYMHYSTLPPTIHTTRVRPHQVLHGRGKRAVLSVERRERLINLQSTSILMIRRVFPAALRVFFWALRLRVAHPLAVLTRRA